MNDKIREALEIGKGHIEAELARRKEAMPGFSHRWIGVERDLAAVDAALSTHQAAAELPALTNEMVNFGEAAHRFGRRDGAKWIFDDLALSMFVGSVVGDVRAALATTGAQPAGVADVAYDSDGLVMVRRSLLGAACAAITKKADAPNTLASLRDAIRHADDDLESLRDADAMLKEIGIILRGQTRFTGSYAEIVRQLLAAPEAPATTGAGAGLAFDGVDDTLLDLLVRQHVDALELVRSNSTDANKQVLRLTAQALIEHGAAALAAQGQADPSAPTDRVALMDAMMNNLPLSTDQRSAIYVVLAAQGQAEPAPGFVLVPVEPTGEMIERCCVEHASAPWPEAYGTVAQEVRRIAAEEGWRAMLAAAPQPNGPAGEQS